MAVTLQPGEIAFQYGESLSAANNGINVQIVTQSNAAGEITLAQLQIIYNINPALIISGNADKPAAAFALKPNQVSFPANHQIHDHGGGDVLSITFSANTPFLNLKMPLADGKRDLGD